MTHCRRNILYHLQIEYHPYVLAHLQPVLDIHEKHGIVTQSFGTLTPTLRHPTGGPLKPVLERISRRISQVTGKNLDPNVVLILWARAHGVVVVTASGNPERIKALGDVSTLPDILLKDEIEEIDRVGKTIHYPLPVLRRDDGDGLPNSRSSQTVINDAPNLQCNSTAPSGSENAYPYP